MAAPLPIAEADDATRASLELWGHVRWFVRWLKISLSLVTAIALAFLALEAVRMYQTLSGVHPALGFASLVALGVGVAFVLLPARRFLLTPRVVEPPPLPLDGRLTTRQLAAELRYLDRYLANCARNPAFAPERDVIDRARRELKELFDKSNGASDGTAAVFAEELAKFHARSMDPVLRRVDERADRVIYQEALAVGLATAVSPNGVLDAFVMLWRSVKLVSEMGVLYYGRPGLLGSLAICRDVSMAVAAAGYMQNLSETLGAVLAKTLGGWGGLVAGPAVDGITNALVLIRIGFLAKERCRSYRRWDAAARQSAVATAVTMTQKVAYGLSAEILRQVGWGVSAAAGKVVEKACDLGASAKETIGSAAEKAMSRAGEALESVAQAARSALRSAADAVSEVFPSPDPRPPDRPA